MTGVTNLQKLKLLLWKNWLLQWNSKFSTILELLIPTIFFVIVLFLRITLPIRHLQGVEYKPVNISNINGLKEMVSNKIEYKLFYSPENPILEKIVNLTAEKLKLSDAQGYPNAVALEKAFKGKQILAGIQFDDGWSTLEDYPKNFSFALRFPSELRYNNEMTWLTSFLYLPMDLTGPRNYDAEDGGYPVGYLREGFLPIQNALAMSYIELVSENKDLPDIDMQRYPYPDYIFDPLLENVAIIIFCEIMILMIPATSIVKQITAEKENQLKEVMKIMGLNGWIHWLAWFVKAFIMMGISMILIVVLCKINVNDVGAVFVWTHWSVLLVFLLVYTVDIICFCFMLATFFSKANTAAVVSGLLWFCTYLPFVWKSKESSLASKLAMCLFPNTAAAFGLDVILRYEGTGEGSQWDNLFTSVNIDDNLTLGYVIVMMLISCVLYLCICLYVEQVFPGEYGVPRKWYFIFTAEFWCCKKVKAGVNDVPNEKVERQKANAFEREPAGLSVGLQVKNLKKNFGKKTAVNGLSLNMYEDEITVLLGHNGAGKTTTISMLVGMFPPTSGTAIINGFDIRTNMSGARMSMGVCPQHNVLFDDLTVAQHLKFFSRLKGLKGKAMKKDVNKYIQLIDLEEKKNVASKKLSGGMKRKLSVCCALTGNAKIVLLDEPSSGLDPSARRQLWDLLQAEKTGRTILLTTHFMDEADVLGDRIAIMCDGELKCHGSSFFLKKKFGSGYRLICVKRRRCKSANVTTVLRRYIPDLRPESEIGSELTYLLPDSYSNQFEKMLSGLESQSDDLRISGYGISISSLEEVFMKMGAENAKEETRKPTRPTIKNDGTDDNEDAESTTSDRLFSENKRLLKGGNLLCNQWHAMMLKKFLSIYYNKIIFLILFIYIIFNFACLFLRRGSNDVLSTQLPLTIDLFQYPSAVIVLETAPDVAEDSLQHKISRKYQAIIKSYGSQYEFVTTDNQNFSSFILELGEAQQVRINDKYLASATITNKKITAWLNNQPFHTAPLTVNLVHNALVKAVMGNSYEITVTNQPLPYTTNSKLDRLTKLRVVLLLPLIITYNFCILAAFYICFLIKERVTRYKLLQFVGGVRIWTFWLSQFLCDYLTYALIVLVLIILAACCPIEGLSTFPQIGRFLLVLLLFGCSALPFTYIMSFMFNDAATGFVRIFVMNIITGLFCAFIPDISNDSLREFLSFITGIFPHFSLFNSLQNLQTNEITKAACSDELVTQMSDADRCENVPKCCTSTPYFAWEKPGILVGVVYLSATAVVYFLILILLEYNFCNRLKQFYHQTHRRFHPPTQPSNDQLDEDVAKEQLRIRNMSTADFKVTNLVLDRVTKCYGSLIAVNKLSLCVKPVECFGLLGVNGAGKTTTFKMMTGDEYITYGKAYVKGMNMAKNMNKIRKEIGYCPQFDGMMIDYTGRQNLKIFCLIRGIRKDRIKPISEELAKAFGFDKYLDEQTKKFSGGNKRKLSAAIALIGSPSIVYLDEPTTGMDPSARRQLWNMVNRIRDSGKSIVLTTHSMEECEALCTRLAIMVNGEFKCLGSKQHLKNRFSKGLVLKIKIKRSPDGEQPTKRSFFRPRPRKSSQVKRDTEARRTENDIEAVPDTASPRMSQYTDSDINNIKSFVEKEFPDAVLQEEYQGMLTYHIPLAIIKWSRMFGIMENNRESLNIEDYSISQTTLEEIFLEFAKNQNEEEQYNDSFCGCCSLWD